MERQVYSILTGPELTYKIVPDIFNRIIGNIDMQITLKIKKQITKFRDIWLTMLIHRCSELRSSLRRKYNAARDATGLSITKQRDVRLIVESIYDPQAIALSS